MEDMHVHAFKEIVVPPTCKVSGHSRYVCDCGYEYTTNFKPIVPHDFQASDGTPATCIQPGSENVVCTMCGETRSRSVSPLGHEFGGWVTQKYPTCLEAGTQVRQCRRCAEKEEMPIPPAGHRHTPQTARYANGKMVDFFCINCGQTVSCAPQAPTLQSQPNGHWFTRILLILGLLAALVAAACMVLYDLDPNVKVLWPSYVDQFIMAVWSIVFLVCTNRIKDSQRYARWMGVATLMFAITPVISLVDNIAIHMGVYANEWDMILYLLSILAGSVPPVLILLALSVIFFTGMKKKTWIFVVVLLYTILSALSSVGGIFSIVFTLPEYMVNDVLYIPFLITSSIAGTFLWVCLTALISPVKKPVSDIIV